MAQGVVSSAANSAGDGDDGSGSHLTKVVLARRSDVVFHGHLDPMILLETLQDRDPRAYQVRINDWIETNRICDRMVKKGQTLLEGRFNGSNLKNKLEDFWYGSKQKSDYKYYVLHF